MKYTLTVNTSTDIAAASPNKDNDPEARAPIISETTKIRKLIAETSKIV